MANHFLFLFLLAYFLSVATGNELLIKTKNGRVKGKLLSTQAGQVRAFLGIPYAKPPVGKLRFRAPKPARRWRGVKDATKYGNSCYQLPDSTFPGFKGAQMWDANTPVSEDCLFVNIWTPRRTKTQSLAPVMVWIYGGGFTTGTSSLDLYDGRYLTQYEDVVVVSMNYRLGVFGFLSIPDNPNVRGNAALMDQRLAIQWVVDNIAAFGGDPKQVTLFGESAGSASVGYQVISPGSNGLFQRAVMQSGAPTAPWASLSLDETWKRAIKLGKLMECPTSNSADLEACLQKVDASVLVTAQFGAMTGSGLGYPFIPVVDGVFLPDKIETLIKSKTNRKEVLLGLNENEGSYFMVYMVPELNVTGSAFTDLYFKNALKMILGSASESMTGKVSQLYKLTNDKDPTVLRDTMEKILTDSFFICPVQTFGAEYAESGGKPFLYYFKHRSSINPWPEWMGVMHGYEIEFVFGMPLNPSLGYTEEEVKMSRRFMKHWANFARTGNPGIRGDKWPLFTPGKKAYVTLDTKAPKKKSKLNAAKCSFWDSLL